MSHPHPAITVREATRDDIPTIVAFNRAIALETEHKTLDPHRSQRGVELVFERPGLARYFVAEISASETESGANNGNSATRLAGQLMLTLEWSDWRAGHFWWIQSVYVHPDFRRLGVFKLLYRHVEALARRTPDVCGLRLYVEHENERAMNAYRNLGMTPSGHVVYEIDWSNS